MDRSAHKHQLRWTESDGVKDGWDCDLGSRPCALAGRGLRLGNVGVGLLVGWVVMIWGGGAGAVEAELISEKWGVFAKKYCLECHDGETAKGGLILEGKQTSGFDPVNRALWERVHDRLAEREMPPTGKLQPTNEERADVVLGLRQGLEEASRKEQLSQGRVGLRRLNRVEYEWAVSDLFGIPIELRSHFPEDPVVAGFDKISAGWEMPGEQWIRYLEAADHALDAVMVGRGAEGRSRITRITAKEWYRNMRLKEGERSKLILDAGVRLEGGKVWFFQQSSFHPYYEVNLGKPVSPGRYRVRASVVARNTGEETLALKAFLTGYDEVNDRSLERVLGVKDVVGGEARVVEFELEVPFGSERWKGREVALKGWTLKGQAHPDSLEADRVMGVKLDETKPALGWDWVEMEGPLESAPAEAYEKWFGGVKGKSRGGPELGEGVEKLIREFGVRAYRGLVDPSEMDARVAAARKRLSEGEDPVQVLRAGYKSMMCSVPFLFLKEKPGKLDGMEVAARLALFLWGTHPDAILLGHARDSSVLRPEVLRAETERMLSDARFGRFVDQFAAHWLGLKRLYETKPDLMYGEFDDLLLWSMPMETREFVSAMIREDRSVREWVDSDWSYLNRRLAQHYGMEGVKHWEVRRVTLPANSHRGGILTHASVLKVTANGTTTSPVLRGKWLLERLIGKPPHPPPPNIVAIEPDIRGATTIREQLDKHRNVESCNRCHQHIDPPGFVMESYDVIGGWREYYRVKDLDRPRMRLGNYPGMWVSKGGRVETEAEMVGGVRVKDMGEYRKVLAGDAELLARAWVSQLVVYATGVPVQFADRAEVERVVRESAGSGYGVRTLIHGLVQSRIFMEK